MFSALSLKDYDWRFNYDGALFTLLRVIPDLKQMIVNVQRNDTKLQEIVQLVSTGDKSYYAIDESGCSWYKFWRKKILYGKQN